MTVANDTDDRAADAEISQISGLTLLWGGSLCERAASRDDWDTTSLTGCRFTSVTLPLPRAPLMTFPLPWLLLMTSLAGKSCWLTAAFCDDGSDVDRAWRLRCLARPLSDKPLVCSVLSCQRNTDDTVTVKSELCKPLTTQWYHHNSTTNNIKQTVMETKQTILQNTECQILFKFFTKVFHNIRGDFVVKWYQKKQQLQQYQY